jgi:hypothetical protein
MSTGRSQGTDCHFELIRMSRAMFSQPQFEDDPKMLAWEIAAVKAGSFRR